MKLLLTSMGLSNKTLRNEFIKLVEKEPKDIEVAYIMTASIPEPDKEYCRQDLENLRKTGVENINEIDISQNKETWEGTMKNSDVIFVEGGNTYFLLYWFKKSGLFNETEEILKDKIYVGVSAGSIVAGPDISFAGWQVGFWDRNIIELVDSSGLSLISFGLFPHFKKSWEADLKTLSKGVNFDMYAIDDNMAYLVNGNEAKFIGEGEYLKLN